VADRWLTDTKVAAALSTALRTRPKPEAITVDNGTEFVSRTMDAWALRTTSGKTSFGRANLVENAFIESFNGRLRDECLNSHVLATVADPNGYSTAGARTATTSDPTPP
jgi:putative transposase